MRDTESEKVQKRKLRDFFPHHRRRSWRYVSPRRHTIGLGGIALVIVLSCVYWYLTNTVRIRQLSEEFLGNLIVVYKPDVTVSSAEFSLFGGIQVNNVSIRWPVSEGEPPTFKPKSITLDHNPWKLMWTGKLHPTRIVVNGGTLAFSKEGGVGQFVSQAFPDDDDTQKSEPIAIPEDGVFFRNITIEFYEIVKDKGTIASDRDIYPVTMSILVDASDSDLINISIKGTGVAKGPIDGTIVYDRIGSKVVSSDITWPWQRVANILPPGPRNWLVKRDANKGTSRVISTKDEGVHIVLLSKCSLNLLPEEGGLKLANISGRFLVDLPAKEVTVTKISGQIGDSASTRFEISGKYGSKELQSSYESADCFCEISLSLFAESLPKPDIARGQLAKMLGRLHELFQLGKGQYALEMRVKRLPGGEIDYSGSKVTFKDVQGKSSHLPYPFDDLTGEITFDSNGASNISLHALAGTVSITGHWLMSGEESDYKIDIQARELPLDHKLANILPKPLKTAWDQLQPSGKADIIARFSKKGAASADPIINVSIKATGLATVKPMYFPYPMTNLEGEIVFDGSEVKIKKVRSYRNSKLLFTINGAAENANSTDLELLLDVDIQSLPLDKTLLRALPANARKACEYLIPQKQLAAWKNKTPADDKDSIAKNFGLIDSGKAKISYNKKSGVDYRVTADLIKTSLTCKPFPLPVSDITGSVIIDPRHIEIETDSKGIGLRGKHCLSLFTLAGDVVFGDAVMVNLAITGSDVLLDRKKNPAIYHALPVNVKKVWDQLDPKGLADLNVKLQHNPRDTEKLDYRVELTARDMSLKYRHFPLELKGIKGVIVATPGKVALKGISASTKDSNQTVNLAGVITSEEKTDEGKFELRVANLKIDDELLQALPESMSKIAEKITPGGSCGIDLTSLTYSLPSAAEVKGRSKMTWRAKGVLSFDGVTVNLGFGPKSLSGQLRGIASSSDKGLSLDCTENVKLAKQIKGGVMLRNIDIGDRRITTLKGQLRKDASSDIVKLTNLDGQAHGGKIAGRAIVKLDDPIVYEVRLVLDRIDLNDVFNAKITDAEKRSDVSGLLSGNIFLEAKGDNLNDINAEGKIKITDAKLYKLPVLLGLLHVVYLTLPQEAAFKEGTIDYRISKSKLVIDEIWLNGNALSMVGSGQMDLKTKRLDLNFFSGPPGGLPVISKIGGDLLKIIFNQLEMTRVTGTLDKPKITSVILPGVKKIVEILTSPGEQ